jgi:hypothetical protein
MREDHVYVRFDLYERRNLKTQVSLKREDKKYHPLQRTVRKVWRKIDLVCFAWWLLGLRVQSD